MKNRCKTIKKIATGVSALFALASVSLGITAFCYGIKGDSLTKKVENSQEYKDYSSNVHTDEGVRGFIKSGYSTTVQKADYSKLQYCSKVETTCFLSVPLAAMGVMSGYACYAVAKNEEEKLK